MLALYQRARDIMFDVKIMTTQKDSWGKIQNISVSENNRALTLRSGGERYPRRKRVSSFTWTFLGKQKSERHGRRGKKKKDWEGAGGQRKRWPPTIRSSFARSFTYSLSSLVSILSPLCVLLIYRAAGKCLRHSPSIVQPISLLFFLLLHLRVSSRHFLFPSPVRSPCERFAPFSAALLPRIPHSLLHRSEYIDWLWP